MKTFFSRLLFTILVSLIGTAFAANLDNPVSGIFHATMGDTIMMEVPSTVSKSPDNLPGNLTFQINSNTGYRDFNQLTDLKDGDPIQVEYKMDERSKQMIATMISRNDSKIVTTVTTTTSPEPAVTVPVVEKTTTTTTTKEVTSNRY
jgi:hypothetical protein